MEQQVLKLNEINQLYVEINGMVDDKGSKTFIGLKEHKLIIPARYWLDELNITITTEKGKIDKVRDELIGKYGKPDENGNLVVHVYNTDGQGYNQGYVDFHNEFATFLNEEKEIQYTPLNLEYFKDVNTDTDYKIIFRFMKP